MAYFGFAERTREYARKEAELRELASLLARHPAIGADEFKRLLDEMQKGITEVRVLAGFRGAAPVVSICRDVEKLQATQAI